MIYTFKVLDKQQENERREGLGDELLITNQNDSVCQRITFIEENWTWVMEGQEKRGFKSAFSSLVMMTLKS